jgi:PKD repeat protein
MKVSLPGRRSRAVDGAPKAHLVLFVAALLMVSLASARAVSAQTCDRTGCGYLTPQCGGSPATPVPQQIWQGGVLQPADPGPLPPERDGTNFDEFGSVGSYYTSPFFFDITTTANPAHLFVVQAWRFQVWDVSANPASPKQIGNLEVSDFPSLPSGEPKWPLNSLAVPPDTDSMAAVTGDYNVGLGIIDTSNPAKPRLAYQSAQGTQGPNGNIVYAATLGGAHYAFMAQIGGPVLVFNMDRAIQTGGACNENVAVNPGHCPGVYAGSFGGNVAMVSGVDNLLATSTTNTYPAGINIYDVTNPANPVLKTSVLTNAAVWGTAMWKDAAGNYWVGGRTQDADGVLGLGLVNVTCAVSGCGSAPQAAFYATSVAAPGGQVSLNEIKVQRHFLTYSKDGNGTPYLYIGSENRCHPAVLQAEWLVDVSNPAAPHDVTPPAGLFNGLPTGYWGWYYRGNPTGFNLEGGRHGKFIGQYFYRAAWTVFDVHKLTTNSPPIASFSYSPAVIYPGTPVTFTDLTSGGPHTDSWTFSPDGTPPSASVAGPTASFASKGGKTVTLTATSTGGLGSNQSTQTLNVLDPFPAVQSVTVSPSSPLQCQPVTLTAAATGQPALAYAWSVLNSGSSQVATGSTNPFTWQTGAGTPAGTYTANVTVSNGAGSVTFPQTVALGALAALPPSLSFAPTNDPFTAGTVQFHVNAAGATQWNWNFGDNPNGGPASDGYTGWTSDPLAGPNPSHNYLAIGNYSVTVKVQNCTVTSPSVSNPLAVNILQTTPLKASFQVQGCQFGFCSFSQGATVQFTDFSTGASFWDYDWDGSGQFADSNHTAPVTSHVFANTGHFTPGLRVRRGASESNTTSSQSITIAPAVPPSIGVTGPVAGVVSTAYTYTASAVNCTPAATWSWTVTGGGVGSSTSSTITVTWGAAGSYSVTATNAGCTPAQGTAFVGIQSTTTGGGGPLTAQYSFSPSAPKAGDSVKFDSSASTGGPATWVWNFGDNSSGNGAVVNHTYANAGNYIVSLTETAPGTGAGCSSNVCASQATQTVVVITNGPPPPPPLNPAFGADPAVQCVYQLGFNQCTAATGQTVTLTAAEIRATTYTWDFGDGSGGSGASVTHSWVLPGSYKVQLTVSATGFTTASKSLTFFINGPPPVPTQNLLLPWIAESRGALVQSSDLYIHNPDSGPVDVTLTFLKRGTPDVNPPQVTQTLQPGQTLYAPNVLSGTFNRANVAGFITVSAKTNVPPIMTAFNTTQSNGVQFGQTVPGISLPQSSSSAAPNPPAVQELIGLSDNADEFSYFGISNPNSTNSSYHLRFFDATGALIGDSGGDVMLGSFGQKQYQVRDIRHLFGVKNATDYRIEVDTTSGGQVYPFGARVRFTSQAPAFTGQALGSAAAKLYLLGASTNAASWQTDAVLANTGSQAVTSTLTFTKFGAAAKPSAPKTLTLQPGQTSRLGNAVATEFGLSNTVGVLTVSSTSGGNGLFPVVQGETFNVANPANQFGQATPILTDDDAAASGKSHYLVGLRQDANNQTTMWLFNPSSALASFDVVFRGLDGSLIKTVPGLTLPPGRLRQFLPAQLPLPAGGVQNGFTVQVTVHAGTILGAAQVVNLTSGAPAYIKGVTR